MSNAVQSWVDLAQYDIETAQAMLDARRYLYVLFCCQQAVEKMLKALVARETNEYPPRTHNLLALAETVHVHLTPENTDLLRNLTGFCIGSRYAQVTRKMPEGVDAAYARKQFDATQEMLRWLSSMLR